MYNLCCILTFDAYLLDVSVLGGHHQGKRLCQLLEKTPTVMTLLSTGSVL